MEKFPYLKPARREEFMKAKDYAKSLIFDFARISNSPGNGDLSIIFQISEDGEKKFSKQYFNNIHIGSIVYLPDGSEIDYFALIGDESLRLTKDEFEEYLKVFDSKITSLDTINTPPREELLKAKTYARNLCAKATLDCVATVTYDNSKDFYPEFNFFTNTFYKSFGESKIALREPNTRLFFSSQLLEQLVFENGKAHISKYYFGKEHIATVVLSPEGDALDFFALLENESVRLNGIEFEQYLKIFRRIDEDFSKNDLKREVSIIKFQVDAVFSSVKAEITQLQTELEINKIQKDRQNLYPYDRLSTIKQKLARILLAHFNHVGFPESKSAKREPFFKKMNGKYYYLTGQNENNLEFMGLDKNGIAYRATLITTSAQSSVGNSSNPDTFTGELIEEPILNNLFF